MKIALFAIACFLAIFLVTASVVILTGAIDHHFGYFGSIIKAIPSSVVATLVTTIAFSLTSIGFKGQRTRCSFVITGGVSGAVSHPLTWLLSRQLQEIHILAVLLPYVVIGIIAFVLSRPRNL